MESEHPDNYFSYGHTTTDMRGRWAAFAAEEQYLIAE